MSGVTTFPPGLFPIANFPAVGPVGGYYNFGPAGGIAQIAPDQEMWVGGPLLYSILAELRLHSQLLAVIANVSDNLQTLRNDAVADMGTLYTSSAPTPTPSS